MKIAQIAPLYESVPPKYYGGTERIISYLCEALVALGHDVTLFASGDSVTSAKLIPVRGNALWLDTNKLNSPIAAHATMLAEVRRRAAEFDVLHFHISHFQHFPFFEHMRERTVTTPHGRLDYADLPEAYARWPGFPMISISDRQRQPLAKANWIATVQHGLPLDLYRPPATGAGEGSEPYLAFLGRLSRDKRPDRAIEIAKKANMTLKIAAKVGEGDRVYFHDTVEPLLDDPLVDYVGEVVDSEKSDFLGNAAALVFPIDWPEPFGLVLIEAMACGTPVIAWNNGASPEIIDEGITGFVVNSIDEAVAAVAKARQLDRARIRATFERRFSADAMARRYVSVYSGLIASNQSVKSAHAAGLGAGADGSMRQAQQPQVAARPSTR